ncbi:hypothetical protein [Chryseobacterium sp. GVT01B]|nr:hypothetical protein [Chryseobacterium sp. GVT01B]
MLLPKTPVIKKMTKDVSDSGHWGNGDYYSNESRTYILKCVI